MQGSDYRSRAGVRSPQPVPLLPLLAQHRGSHPSLAIVAISVGYAALLAHTRAYERRVAAALAAQANAGTPSTSSYAAVDTTPRGDQVFKLPKHARVRRAALYAASVAIAYWVSNGRLRAG